MAYNIDGDPINRNWLRWRAWNFHCEDLAALLSMLEVSEGSVREQTTMLMRIRPLMDNAPQSLRFEVDSFLERNRDNHQGLATDVADELKQEEES
jgi:hypothetical protein